MVNDITTTTTTDLTPATAAAAAATTNGTAPRRSSFSQPKPKVLRPFNTAEVKILLLENVNETAVKAFKKQGYQVKGKNNKHLEFPPLCETWIALVPYLVCVIISNLCLSLYRSRPMLRPLSVMNWLKRSVMSMSLVSVPRLSLPSKYLMLLKTWWPLAVFVSARTKSICKLLQRRV